MLVVDGLGLGLGIDGLPMALVTADLGFFRRLVELASSGTSDPGRVKGRDAALVALWCLLRMFSVISGKWTSGLSRILVQRLATVCWTATNRLWPRPWGESLVGMMIVHAGARFKLQVLGRGWDEGECSLDDGREP